MADINNEAPLAAPWYTSAVQVNGVIAAVAQIASVILRIVARYVEVRIDDQDIQLLVADIAQVVAIGFCVIAIIKRQTSKVQPLTMTQAGADKKTVEIIAGSHDLKGEKVI